MAEQKRKGQKIEEHLLLEGKKLKEKLAKLEEDTKHRQGSKITNQTSEKYISNKFHKEFEKIVHEMFDSFDKYLPEVQPPQTPSPID
jgi:hypothetical protein